MSSEAQKYWRYSQECTRQAVQADALELRDRLLDLARLWKEAAMCEEMNAKRLREEVSRRAVERDDVQFPRRVRVTI
jgi:hypothetical protein